MIIESAFLNNNKYSSIIEKIILSTEDDLQIAKEVENYLSFFKSKWLKNLSLEEKNFFENNRLRINKIFSLLLALDFLVIKEENENSL